MLPKTTPTCPAISGCWIPPSDQYPSCQKMATQGTDHFFIIFAFYPPHPGIHPGVLFCHTHISKLVMLLLPLPIYHCRFHFLDTQPPVALLLYQIYPICQDKNIKNNNLTIIYYMI